MRIRLTLLDSAVRAAIPTILLTLDYDGTVSYRAIISLV